MHDGWRFNFDKELRKLKNATGYLLVTDEAPLIVEGCIIFQLIDRREPYLAMLEVAPHNQTKDKKYDWIAGCLIAIPERNSVNSKICAMEKKKESRQQSDVTLRPKDGHARSAKHKAIVAAAAKEHNAKRSTARLIRNEMLAIRYQMESYILDQTVTINKMRSIRDFANDFLHTLNLKKGEFANYIEIDLANLNKYYKEERKFNAELALKFGYFFHTPADLWLRVQFKNEMLKFEKETKLGKKYKRYDYEKFLQNA